MALPPRQTSRDVVRWLHRDLISRDELTERDLQDDLTHVLAETPRILIVEHAHRLTKDAAGQLQWLHARPGAQLSLILVGGPGTLNAVGQDGELSDAVCQTVTVSPLHGDPLIRALQDMHDLFLGAGPDLLSNIDRAVCHGRLGNWVRFLQVAVHLRDQIVHNGGDAPVLNMAFAKTVIHRLPATLKKAA